MRDAKVSLQSLTFALIACCVSWHNTIALGIDEPVDSSRQRFTWVVTPRLNSSGHFPFTGAMVNRNINADVNIFLEYNKWGLFLFKSHDLEQRRSPVNYFQPGLFRTIRLNPNLYVRVFFGYVFSQQRSFRDPDSDYYAAPVLYWTIRPGLKLENCTLLFDLRSEAKLANRLRLAWAVGSFRLDAFVWQRWVFAEDQHATSASLAFELPPVPISRSTEIVSSISYQGYVSRAKPDFALRDGFLFTLAIAIKG
jgi:hypothetical protein